MRDRAIDSSSDKSAFPIVNLITRRDAVIKLVSGQIQPMPGMMALLAMANRGKYPNGSSWQRASLKRRNAAFRTRDDASHQIHGDW
jgi:hypothetical protein